MLAEIERRVLRSGGDCSALLRHVLLDVREDRLELRFIADRVERGVEVADVTPRRAPPAGTFGDAKRSQGLVLLPAEGVDPDVGDGVAGVAESVYSLHLLPPKPARSLACCDEVQ